ncbi:hypothetical protein FDK38_002320 [Candidozyma auris]|nr:hypothetical protein FDK38_002320 [[Candida] auris]
MVQETPKFGTNSQDTALNELESAFSAPPNPTSAPTSSMSPDFHKSSNPFANGQFSTTSSTRAQTQDGSFFENNDNIRHVATSITRDQLRKYPFKTSNRIFSDLKYTPEFFHLRDSPQLKQCRVPSLLSARPIDYATYVSHVLVHDKYQYEPLILNNSVDYVPAFQKYTFPEKNLSVSIVRGLLVSKANREVCHFRLTILEHDKPKVFLIDKHEFHVLPRDAISPDDLEALGEDNLSTSRSHILDDVFYKSLNAPYNMVMRVTVFNSEFTPDETSGFTDSEIVNDRFTKAIKNLPDSPASQMTKFDPIHCIQTLIKVLKGPILHPEGQPLQTIPKVKSALEAKVDVSLLFDKMGFSLNEQEQLFVPPDLSKNPALRESFIRKAYELMFLGKTLTTVHVNDFDRLYSYNTTMSRSFSALSETDKYNSVTSFQQDNSDRFAFFVALSCCSFFKDDIIIKCFENTVKSDPKNKLFYVDHFKNIMSYRSTVPDSNLQSYYQNQYRKGLMHGFTEYKDALKSIGVDGVSPGDEVDNDVVIGMYKQSCQSDPRNYTYFNKQLRVIAAIKHNEALLSFIDTELIPAQIALNELQIEEITEDDVVVTAYEFRLDEVLQSVNFNAESQEIQFLNRCLLSIAVSRKSYILMTYIENKVPNIFQNTPSFSVEEAFRYLGADAQTSDFEMAAKFQERISTSEVGDVNDFISLRTSLHTIAEARKSDILFSFLRDGKIDSSLLPPENWPAGLDNIGNTCYLNSLLQYYFCIKPLRETILAFDDSNLDSLKSKKRKIGGRDVEVSELQRSGQFVLRLQHLFQEMITTKKRCVQPSKQLAYLSFLPLSQHVNFKVEEPRLPDSQSVEEIDKSGMPVDIPSFQPSCEDILMSDKENDVREYSPPPLLEMNSPEQGPQEPEAFSDKRCKTPENESKSPVKEVERNKIMSISTDQIESTIEIGRQQDVTECIENVTFQIETALEPTKVDEDGEQHDLVKRLFCGKTKQTLTPIDESDSKKTRSSFERFFSLIINVSDHPKDIYDALDNYFSEDIMHLEEGAVKKSTTITELPEILQFHIQRVLFDRERLMAYKSLEAIPFGETIYLDRYLDTDDEEIKKRRSQVYEWKAQVAKLQEEKEALLRKDPETNLSVIDALQATKKFLETKLATFPELSVKPSTIEAISKQIDHFKSKLQSIHDNINALQQKSANLFDEYKKIGYTLFAIFIHRGEASYGHYWVYIKDLQRNIYRKYNDDVVTEVPASEVLNFAEGNTATPYYMVFVKEELKEAYIEPLKREPA